MGYGNDVKRDEFVALTLVSNAAGMDRPEKGADGFEFQNTGSVDVVLVGSEFHVRDGGRYAVTVQEERQSDLAGRQSTWRVVGQFNKLEDALVQAHHLRVDLDERLWRGEDGPVGEVEPLANMEAEALAALDARSLADRYMTYNPENVPGDIRVAVDAVNALGELARRGGFEVANGDVANLEDVGRGMDPRASYRFGDAFHECGALDAKAHLARCGLEALYWADAESLGHNGVSGRAWEVDKAAATGLSLLGAAGVTVEYDGKGTLRYEAPDEIDWVIDRLNGTSPNWNDWHRTQARAVEVVGKANAAYDAVWGAYFAPGIASPNAEAIVRSITKAQEALEAAHVGHMPDGGPTYGAIGYALPIDKFEEMGWMVSEAGLLDGVKAIEEAADRLRSDADGVYAEREDQRGHHRLVDPIPTANAADALYIKVADHHLETFTKTQPSVRGEDGRSMKVAAAVAVSDVLAKRFDREQTPERFAEAITVAERVKSFARGTEAKSQSSSISR